MAEPLKPEETQKYAHKLTVKLNGTDTNPFHKYGVSQNPFPQIPDARWTGACLRLQKLGGDPIPDTDYIRRVLDGFNPEFVDLCCNKFVKGEMVTFDVYFN